MSNAREETLPEQHATTEEQRLYSRGSPPAPLATLRRFTALASSRDNSISCKRRRDSFVLPDSPLSRRRRRSGGPRRRRHRFSQVTEPITSMSSRFCRRSRVTSRLSTFSERSRAHSMLTMLAERDVMFSADVPEALDPDRRHADADYERAQAELSKLSPEKEGTQLVALLGRMRTLREEQVEIAERIKTMSPKYAALKYPKLLDLAGTRAVLDPGTLLLHTQSARKSLSSLLCRRTSGMALLCPSSRWELARRTCANRWKPSGR